MRLYWKLKKKENVIEYLFDEKIISWQLGESLDWQNYVFCDSTENTNSEKISHLVQKKADNWSVVDDGKNDTGVDCVVKK